MSPKKVGLPLGTGSPEKARSIVSVVFTPTRRVIHPSFTTGPGFQNRAQPFAPNLLSPVAYPIHLVTSSVCRSRWPDKRLQIQNTAVSQPPLVQQIEGIENWGATTEKQFVEDAPAFRAQADNFAVDHCVLYFQLGEIFPQALETFVRVSLPRD